jgi:hypothetical protein
VKTLSPQEIAIFRQMSPAAKLALIATMHLNARAWKKAAFRSFHPEWTEQQVEEQTRQVFLRGSP